MDNRGRGGSHRNWRETCWSEGRGRGGFTERRPENNAGGGGGHANRWHRGGARGRGDNGQSEWRGGGRGADHTNRWHRGGGSSRGGNNHSESREPAEPMSRHKLRRYEDAHPDDLILALVATRSGFRELLQALKGEKNDYVTEMVLRVLAKAVQSTFSPQNLLYLLQMIHQTSFLMGPAVRMLSGSDMVQDLLKVIKCYQERMPTQSLSIVNVLLPQIQVAIARICTRIPTVITSLIDEMQEQDALIQRQFQRGDLQKDKDQGQEELEAPCDFRRLSVIPCSRDIQPDMKPFIRKNKVQGSYKDANHYLDVQFRLLREDCIKPLREGIREYRRNLNKRENRRLQDIRVYEHARILEPYCGHKAVVHLIEFDVSSLKKVKWETSKRLISGSLLCFSRDDFKTALFGTIVDRNEKELAKGNLYVQFEGLNIQLLNSNPYEEYVMVESGAYFESYVHNLEGLKDFSNSTLPFQRYLLCNEDKIEILAPKYLLSKPTTYDFSSVVVDKANALRYYNVNPLDLKAWPSKEEMGLDPSQYQAIQTAISKEYSVIQGPPGTGKTFIGLKISRVLLENKDAWLPNRQSRPILVVCYTNHALDQFLEGILEFTEPFDRTGNIPQIARLGGRVSSDNPMLQKCLLKNIKAEARVSMDLGEIRIGPRQIREMKTDAIEGKEATKEQIEILSNEIEGARKSIIHEYYLQHLMTHNHKRSFDLRTIPEGHSIIQTWLLENMDPGRPNENLVPEPEIPQARDTPVEEEEDFDEDDFGGEEEMANRILENFEIDKQRKSFLGETQVLLSVDSLMEKQRSGQNDDADGGWVQVRGKKDVRNLVHYLQSRDCMTQAEADAVRDVWRLSLADRWRLYHYWMAKYCEDKMLRMRTLHRQYDTHARQLSELYDEEDYRILRSCAVIGMTTTGAAKYRRLVKRIAPLIVIVEEAAEVLEAHIITALNESCRHVILIGDHQQLKPNPTNYKLATEYHLNVSLFERMVKNKLHCDTLGIQHRMRPEIAELIVPHIYEKLENHESVLNFEKIKGVQGNLFFISHTMKELSQEDTRSHSNEHEANYLISLYEYFLKQGYVSSQITILTLYTGQMFAIRRLMKQKQLEYTRVTPVDNYQGEENDIILLSLVRSNEMGSIGFLKISNRVCVALSRAKKGFYVIGNMKQMQEHSHLWNSIIESLNQKNKVVEALPLACQNHPDIITLVTKPEDFKKAPEGGCMKPCDFRLECGHVCIFKCHPIDPEHKDYQCDKPCARRCKTNGDDGHMCMKLCFQDCGRCKIPVTKTIPGCGHDQDVPCHQDPATFLCQAKCSKKCETNGEDGHHCRKKCSDKCGDCTVKVAKDMPICGHMQAVPCFMDPKHFKCEMTCNNPCETNGEDAHLCKKKCAEECGNCTKLVRKIIPRCGHPQMVPCHQISSSFSCQLPCERKPFDCNHLCPDLCGETCPLECMKVVTKQLPCGHQLEAECNMDISELKCLQKIDRSLQCGHVIKEICSKDLSGYKCNKTATTELECGHTVATTCHQKESGLSKDFKCQVKLHQECKINTAHSFIKVACSDKFGVFFGCTAPCKAKLACGHTCHGKCGECLGQYHPPCTAACSRILPCLHPCKGKCGELCNPCQFECTSCCPHSVCRNRCGESCQPCRKECIWTCAHHSCNKRCGEICDREPCDEPCPSDLPCGHRCMGFCGEPCPIVCTTCNGEFQQQSQNLRRDQYVLLFPCNHCIESNVLEDWFNKCVSQSKTHVHGPIRCPVCSSKVTYCPRYGDILKRNAREYARICAQRHNENRNHMGEIQMLELELQSKFNEQLKENRGKVTANWLSNAESLAAHLTRIQMSTLNGKRESSVPIYSDTEYLKFLSTPGQTELKRATCGDLQHINLLILFWYNYWQEGGNLKPRVFMEVLFGLLSGQPVCSTEAITAMDILTEFLDIKEEIEMETFKFSEYFTKTHKQHLEGAVWVACSQGHVFRETSCAIKKLNPGQAVQIVCIQCLERKPVPEDDRDGPPQRAHVQQRNMLPRWEGRGRRGPRNGPGAFNRQDNQAYGGRYNTRSDQPSFSGGVSGRGGGNQRGLRGGRRGRRPRRGGYL